MKTQPVPQRKNTSTRTSDAVTTRAARPEDAPLLSEVMKVAGQSHLPHGYWEVAWDDPQGAEELRRTLILLDQPSYASWKSFLVAERYGRPVGAVSAYDATVPGFLKPMDAIALGLEKMGRQPDLIDQVLSRMEPFGACRFEPEPGVWTTEWVAVRPGARGRGIGSYLLRRILERGKAQRFVRAQAVTYVDDPEAIRLFTRLGFEKIEERKDPRFEKAFGCPGMVRLETNL